MANQWPEEEMAPSTDADVPFGNSPDFELPDDVETPADLDDGQFPLGPNLFFVAGFDGDPKSIPLRIQVTDPRTGRTAEHSGETMQATLWLALRKDPKRKLKLNLQLPPLDPEFRRVWQAGKQWDDFNKEWKKAAGYQSTTFFLFVDRLFHDVGGAPKGGKLPQAAKKLENWTGREIIATIQTMPNGGYQPDQRSFVAATPENIKAMEAAKAGQAGVQAPNARAVPAPAARPVSPSQPRAARPPAAAVRQAVEELDM
jgi:hypothetical protein